MSSTNTEENIVLTMCGKQMQWFAIYGSACIGKSSLYGAFTLTIFTPSEGDALKCQRVMFHSTGHTVKAVSYK